MSELYNSIEELVLELEDESGLEKGRTVAVVPGAFRPPHLGHLQMVEHYSNQADEVVVLVSSSLRGNRSVGSNSITPQQSQQIWEELLRERGLTNVKVEMSSRPTRSSAIIEYIGESGPLEHGTSVMLGLGNIGDNLLRYEKMDKQAKVGVTVLPVSETAMEPVMRQTGEPFRSSDLRKMLDEGENVDEFFGENKTDSVRTILGMIDEISMGGGAAPSVEGYGAPIGTKRKKRNKKQSEYNELYLYKEVLKLLMKEGVIK